MYLGNNLPSSENFMYSNKLDRPLVKIEGHIPLEDMTAVLAKFEDLARTRHFSGDLRGYHPVLFSVSDFHSRKYTLTFKHNSKESKELIFNEHQLEELVKTKKFISDATKVNKSPEFLLNQVDQFKVV